MKKEEKIIPLEGEKHYTSTVFVISQEPPKRVLLIHHKKLDKWMPPGGHQEFSENPYEAAVREVKEETGIDIIPYIEKPKAVDGRALSLPVPNYIFEEKIDVRDEQPKHYHLDMIYVIEIPYHRVGLRSSESHEIGWFTAEEIKTLQIFDNVRIIIQSVLGSLPNG